MGKPINTKPSGCVTTSSNCVVWQGPDISFLDLCTGDTVSDVIVALADKVCLLLNYTDSKTLTTLINLFDDYSNKIYIKDVFTTRINLFLSKIESALHDLNGLLPENKERMEILISKITVLIKMGYFKPYKNYVDPYGKGYNDIVESMNILGNTIIIGTNENND